jgi:hypothetical protein
VSRIDIFGKRIEIYKAKMLLFVAIASGSWVYTVKLSESYLAILLLGVFVVSTVGIFINVSKLTNIDEILKGLEDD